MRAPILTLRITGPATKGGRMRLSALLQLGKHIQAAVERVGRVLVGQMDSRRAGRKPQEIVQECSLEIVALGSGSFEITLDLPRTKLEPMDLGVAAVEHLFEGVETIQTDGDTLPAGFDAGVLHSLRDIGEMLGENIEQIEAKTRTQRLRREFSLDRRLHQRILARLQSPVSNQRTIEGRLLMADFRHDGERCRLHPPLGEPITCRFDEALAERVYEHLRRYVRVTGETQEDPHTGKMLSLDIRDIESIRMEGEAFETISTEDFWQDKTLEHLAADQSVHPIRQLEDVLGKGAKLWETDEEFNAFLVSIESRGTARA